MAQMISAPAVPQPHAAPLASRLLAWANERFPLENGVVVLLVTALGVLFGRALTHPGSIAIHASDLAAFAAAWCYFLLLRVFDEHKDYELDLHNHPDRVLQSGLITLNHLKLLGAVATGVQAGICIAFDHGIGPITGMWALLMAWTLLMLKEFFIEWPSRWFVLYAFMHMLSMPLAFLWLARIGADTPLPPDVRTLALLGAGIAASLEVARKFRAPEDERPTIDTYTGQLGVRGAGYVLAALVLLVWVASGVLLGDAGASTTITQAVIAAGAAPALIVWPGRFIAKPTAQRAKDVEKGTGASIAIVLVVCVAALLIQRGVA
jgi:4-hydroxybenzoate polyprenyltransferase